MSQFIQAAYSACVLNIKFFLSDHDCDGSVLMSDSCFRRLCKQACSLHLLWIWLACSCASDQMTVRGYRRGCLQLFPFRLIIDRSELHISVVQRSPPPPLTCLRVHTCVKVCGGLYSGRMWNWRRTISDRWWDCASDPVYVRSAVQRRNKGHEARRGHTCVLAQPCAEHMFGLTVEIPQSSQNNL